MTILKGKSELYAENIIALFQAVKKSHWLLQL